MAVRWKLNWVQIIVMAVRWKLNWVTIYIIYNFSFSVITQRLVEIARLWGLPISWYMLFSVVCRHYIFRDYLWNLLFHSWLPILYVIFLTNSVSIKCSSLNLNLKVFEFVYMFYLYYIKMDWGISEKSSLVEIEKFKKINCRSFLKDGRDKDGRFQIPKFLKIL